MSSQSQSPEEQRRAEAESIDREMKVLGQHQADTEIRTANAMRRAPLVIATMVLIALLLWWLT